MSADATFSAMTDAVLTSMAGDDAMTFHGSSGTVTTTGYVYQDAGLLGTEVPVNEGRWVCTLQTASVGSALRGDRVTDRNGQEWVLQERIDADEWMETWTVTKR